MKTRDGLSHRSPVGPVHQPAAPGYRHRSATALQPGVAPPPDYYRNNLLRVLVHVRSVHGDLLAGEEAGFIDGFVAVSRPAQRLFARLVGRRGPQIRLDKLAYAEITDLHGAIDELERTGLVERNADAPADVLLRAFTKDELLRLFDLRTAAKADLVAGIVEQHTDAVIRERLLHITDWLCIAGRQHLDLAQLLFFGGSALGGPPGDLTAFVLEDLGTARYERYRVSRSQRLFGSRPELERYLAALELSELSKSVPEQPDLAASVMNAIGEFPAPPTRLEKRLLDRASNRVGRFFERAGAAEDALACYARSSTHPARERRVRILTRQGNEAAAGLLLREIGANPSGPEEADFAERFGRRRRGGSVPETVVPIARETSDGIENQALDWLAQSGGEGWHLENRLPLGLAGLAFWNVVFAPVDGVFLNPYQTGPMDLFWDDFTRQREELLAAAKAELARPEAFTRILMTGLENKAGTVNRLVSWRHLPGSLVERILETIPHGVLFPLVCHVIENLWRVRSGFPDLLVLYGDRNYEFVEVKGPGDQLQPAQRAWFNYFRENGCNARVLKFKSMGPRGER